jgi:hypothetical protein
MQLIIDGHVRVFVDLRLFRARFALPPEFGVALFEPKDFTGLGSIDRAGPQLNAVRAAVLGAIPPRLAPRELAELLPRLSAQFRQQLYAINDHVGLRDVEIDYAVSGFEEICRELHYALLRARRGDGPPPAFPHIYQHWLQSMTRVSQRLHLYDHQGERWSVQIVTTAYGRAGMIVHTPGGIHYIRDAALACPAEGFMLALLRDVVAALLAAAAPQAEL